jgi:hypothetical protein
MYPGLFDAPEPRNVAGSLRSEQAGNSFLFHDEMRRFPA